MAKWVIKQNMHNMEQGRFGVPASVIDIIRGRGVSEANIEDFLSSAPQLTYDPFLLPDLKESAEALISAAKGGRKICIYGDYDADGITSTALLYSALNYLTEELCYYVPNRFTDGYGLNNTAIDTIFAQGAKLLITVDCGSTSPVEVEYAKSLGMEVIITDHHRIIDDMSPDALFVNPKRPESKYPFRELSGCGVAFKLVQGIQRTLFAEGDMTITKDRLKSLLDLVAISTVADVVPLLDENRNFVKYGLDIINKRTRPGLASLLERLDLSDRIIDSSLVAYILAPNLNALGRMGSAGLGVELLLRDGDAQRFDDLANETVRTNQLRKSVQEETSKLCDAVLAAEDCGDYAPVICVPGAHEGVAGIVAGNLKERLNRPVCIVTPAEDGTLKGTGRSVPGINLHALFENCGDVFTRFGGHAGACGFSLKPDKLEEFRARMQEQVKALIEREPALAEEYIFIEKELAENEKSIEYAQAVKKLEPFGEENPAPLFCIRNARVSNFFTMGADSQHFRFKATAADGIPVGCVLFGRAAEFSDIMYNGATVDVAGELGINEFRGERRLQLLAVDIKASK